MTWVIQSSLETSGIESHAMWNHIPCKVHDIQLALGAFLSSLHVKGHTKCWEAHECDHQFGENESKDIGKSRWLHKEGNARINKVSAMKPGLATIIEKVCISRPFERPATDLHIAANACCIDFADICLSNQLHSLTKSQSTNCSSTLYGSEHTVEFETGVASVSLPITRIHLWVAQQSKMRRLLATRHNTGWMDHHQVHHGSFGTILILDPVYVERAQVHSASRDHCLQWHVQSSGWCYARFT